MFNLKLPTMMALAALLIFATTVMTACGGDDTDAPAGLTDEQVREIVRDQVSTSTSATAQGGLTEEQVREIVRTEAPAPAMAQEGLTTAQVEEAIQAALSGLPQPETGISQADVDAAIRTAIEAMPEPAPGVTATDVEMAVRAALATVPEPGISRAEVEDLLRLAMESLPDAEAELTAEEVRRIAEHTVATVPAKTSPADYTKFFVNSAISRYEEAGLASTIAHYNRLESIDEQWYVFIAGETGEIISHFDTNVLGQNLNGPLGTDARGYNFGPQMLAATEEGTWVSYVYKNPDTDRLTDSDRHLGAVELKHAWVVRHDGLLFGSGWYVNANDFTVQLVVAAVDAYRQVGLEGTMAHFAGPDSATAGLSDTVAYYNASEDIEGVWFAVISDKGGTIVASFDTSLIGRDIAAVYGEEILDASAEGNWAVREATNSPGGNPSLRAWVMEYDGLIFGSGWHSDEQE